MAHYVGHGVSFYTIPGETMDSKQFAADRRDRVPSVLAKLSIDIAYYQTKTQYPYTDWVKQCQDAYNEILSAVNDDSALCQLSRNAAQYFFKMPTWGTAGT